VALGSLSEIFYINDAWESIRESIKTSAKDNLGYHRLKHNKPWFDDGKGKVVPVLKAPCYEGVLGNGGIAPLIL
jgi:hypothetical protein